MSFFKADKESEILVIFKKVGLKEVQPQTKYFVIRRFIPGELLSSRARFRFNLHSKSKAILGHRFKCKSISRLPLLTVNLF